MPPAHPAPAAAPPPDDAPGRRAAASRARTALVVTVPLVAVATLVLGLRLGAGDAVRAAVVFASPPARPAPDGRARLAWQVLTLLDDRGVRETVATKGLVVRARLGGAEGTWTGETNEDGIAEVEIPLTGLEVGTPVELEVRAPGEAEPLARGRARWDEDVVRAGRERARESRGPDAVRPAKREGAVGIDVLVEGERLVTGFDTNAWLRLTLPEGAATPVVELAPEPGLEVASERPSPCPARGAGVAWVPLRLRATGHVTGVGVKAVRDGATVGAWFGALPVAAGAFHAEIPSAPAAGAPFDVRIVAPNPRTVAYAEVQDEAGRAAAAALAVERKGDELPSATFHVPGLAAGLHWLVVSGEPRGAETRAGAAMAWPFLVGAVDGVDATSACSSGPWLLAHPAPRFTRWTALDGLPDRHARNRRRKALGMAVALVSLLAAGLLEALLLTAAARETRAVMAAVTAAADEALGAEGRGTEGGAAMTRGTPGGSLAVGLLLAVIGFALLGALLLAKG